VFCKGFKEEGMDFNFSEEQEMLRTTVAKFMNKECPRAYVRECDENKKVPFEVFNKIAERGWLGNAIPEKAEYNCEITGSLRRGKGNINGS